MNHNHHKLKHLRANLTPMSSNFETLIKGLVEGLLSKDRLVIFHGPPNTGKSFTARVLAEVFGPFVNLDERQLGKDTLVLDDVIKKQARCIWLEEMNFDHDFGPAIKRILSGYKQGARMAKSSKCPYDYYRCPLIILTTNRDPQSVTWLKEEGIAARTITIYWNELSNSD